MIGPPLENVIYILPAEWIEGNKRREEKRKERKGTAKPLELNQHKAAMAPKAEKKPAKKVAKKVAGGKGKKGKSKVESFKIYIYKVLKQVRAGPDRPLSLSFHALELMKVIFILQQDSYGALVDKPCCLALPGSNAVHRCFTDIFRD